MRNKGVPFLGDPGVGAGPAAGRQGGICREGCSAEQRLGVPGRGTCLKWSGLRHRGFFAESCQAVRSEMASAQPVSPWVPLPCSCQGGLASSELCAAPSNPAGKDLGDVGQGAFMSLKLHQWLQHAGTQLSLLRQHIPGSPVSLFSEKLSPLQPALRGSAYPNQPVTSPGSAAPQPHHASLIC